MRQLNTKAVIATPAKAVTNFKNGLYCSEAILKAFNDDYHLGLNDQVLAIATGFGAGLGGAKCCCGSITGGALVLSLTTGRVSAEQSEQVCFQIVKSLHDQFRSRFGKTCCRALTKSVEWGSDEHHQYCERYVEAAAQITEDLLQKYLNG
ncbi:MAG: C-GCAxxG-C-C family protein [Methylocystaceae bacterium]